MAGSQFVISSTLGQSHGNGRAKELEPLLLLGRWAQVCSTMHTASASKWERSRSAPGTDSSTFTHHRRIFLSHLGILLLSFSINCRKPRLQADVSKTLPSARLQEVRVRAAAPHSLAQLLGQGTTLSLQGALQTQQGLCPLGSGCCELGDVLESVAALLSQTKGNDSPRHVNERQYFFSPGCLCAMCCLVLFILKDRVPLHLSRLQLSSF